MGESIWKKIWNEFNVWVMLIVIEYGGVIQIIIVVLN